MVLLYMVTFTIFYHQYAPNVSIYTIHGSYGLMIDNNRCMYIRFIDFYYLYISVYIPYMDPSWVSINNIICCNLDIFSISQVAAGGGGGSMCISLEPPLWLLKMLISDMSGSLLPKNHGFSRAIFLFARS